MGYQSKADLFFTPLLSFTGSTVGMHACYRVSQLSSPANQLTLKILLCINQSFLDHCVCRTLPDSVSYPLIISRFECAFHFGFQIVDFRPCLFCGFGPCEPFWQPRCSPFYNKPFIPLIANPVLSYLLWVHNQLYQSAKLYRHVYWQEYRIYRFH